MSYSPSFENPITENLYITSDLTVDGQINANILNLNEIHAQTGVFTFLDANSITAVDLTSTTASISELTSSSGSFSSGISAPQGNFTSIVADNADITSLTCGTGVFTTSLSAPEILNNIQYVKDNFRDIQDGIDDASSGQAIYLSPGSFGGSTVLVSGKDNIAIIAPPRGQGAICELSGGRALTIQSTSSRITIANLQIEGLLTLASSGNNYFTNIQCLSGITISAGAVGSYFFKDCEIAGAITIPATFAGLITFAQCNFAGATFSLSQVSPLQVQIAQCLNLPVSRPVNATYASANADINLFITLDADLVKTDTIQSSTGSFSAGIDTVDLHAISISSDTASITQLSSSTGVFSAGIDTVDLHAVSATIDNLVINSITVPEIFANSGSFDNVSISEILTVDTINAQHINVPSPSGSDSPYNGWFVVSTKSFCVSAITSLTGPSGYETTTFDKSNWINKYVHFDAVSEYPKIKAKFYPVLYDTVFEAVYREQLYETCVSDPDTILCEFFPNTPSYSTGAFSDYLADLEGTIYQKITSTNFKVQADTDVIFGNLQYVQSGPSDNEKVCVLNRLEIAPEIIPYNQTAVKFKELGDPLSLFNYFDELVRGTYGLYNKKGSVPEREDSYYHNYGRNLTLKQQYLDGKTFIYDIDHIVKSTTSNVDTTYGVCDPNGLTRIHLTTKHLITPGSTITISGLNGEWSVLNGTHVNEIPWSAYYDPIESGNNHMDQQSLKNYAYCFALRFDSSALTGTSTGPNLNWAIYTGNAKLRITHKIEPDMSYAKFVSALLAYNMEAYGTTEHGYLSLLVKDDGTGVPLDDFEDTNYYNWAVVKQSFVASLSNIPGLSQFYNTYSDLSTSWIPADPYDIASKLTLIQDYEYGHNVATNYMSGAQMYQLYYQITGALTDAVDDETSAIRQAQIEVCDIWNVPHGSQMDFIVSEKGVSPGPQWIPFGVSPIDDPNLGLNFFGFGIIQPALGTGSQKIAYLQIPSAIPFITETAGLAWYNPASSLQTIFVPVGQTWLQQYSHPNPFLNGIYALPLGTIMRWFASQGATDIIVDNTNNAGGYDFMSQHFGENRRAPNATTLFANVENQKSSLDDINNYSTFGALAEQYPVVDCSYLNTTYGPGTVWNTGKMILLQSENDFSAGNFLLFALVGENLDYVISQNMELKVLGQSKGYYGGGSLGFCFIPNNTLGNLSDAILLTSISGEAPAINSYVVNASDELKAMNHIESWTEISSNTAPIKSISGNSFLCSMEDLIYPDFGFCENNRSVLPGSTLAQQPDKDDSTTWRYAYLEGAIHEIKQAW
jgi:hypothetical protein